LNQWPAGKRHCVLLGAAAYLYAQGPQNGEPVRDALVWQLGKKRDSEGNGREPGICIIGICVKKYLIIRITYAKNRKLTLKGSLEHQNAYNELISSFQGSVRLLYHNT
jgi:hypothetical protein